MYMKASHDNYVTRRKFGMDTIIASRSGLEGPLERADQRGEHPEHLGSLVRGRPTLHPSVPHSARHDIHTPMVLYMFCTQSAKSAPRAKWDAGPMEPSNGLGDRRQARPRQSTPALLRSARWLGPPPRPPPRALRSPPTRRPPVCRRIAHAPAPTPATCRPAKTVASAEA